MTTHRRVLTIAGALALSAGAAHAQWIVLDLHPATFTNSEAHAISGKQITGGVNLNLAGGGATMWQGSSTGVQFLSTTANAAGIANGCASGHQSGTITVGTGVAAASHAALWNSTAGTLIDLHPGPDFIHSLIYASDDTNQVGSFVVDSGGTFSAGRPCMWTGTAASFIDLTPPGVQTGEVHGVAGGQQVGATFDSFLGMACMWTGTPESFLSLNPADALASAATCTDGEYQYGTIGILDPVTGIFPCRWHGTAESWELFSMPDQTTHWGEVHATHGGVQAGYITDNDGVSNARACVWESGLNSFADLHQYLPAQFTQSNALGVWKHAPSGSTYIVGYAGADDNHRHAVMWVKSGGVNLIVSPGAPRDDTAGAGQSMAYSVRILNAGAVASGPIALTVDLPPTAAAAYVSAVPAPSGVTPAQLTFNLPSLAGAGAFTDLSITLTAVGQGATAAITATASASGEVDPTNNTASASSHIKSVVCYANCDDSSGSPALSAADFTCFLNRFRNNDGYANCDGSTGSPALTAADFTCFLNSFRAGCP